MAVVMVHLGAQLSTLVETQFLHRCLGALLLLYAISGLMTKPPQLSPRLEMILGPVCGAANGLLTGLTWNAICTRGDVFAINWSAA
jgi:uncharacterized membrane protein YfcA